MITILNASFCVLKLQATKIKSPPELFFNEFVFSSKIAMPLKLEGFFSAFGQDIYFTRGYFIDKIVERIAPIGPPPIMDIRGELSI